MAWVAAGSMVFYRAYHFDYKIEHAVVTIKNVNEFKQIYEGKE